VVCIGPVTARAARETGLEVHAVARRYTIPGLLEALRSLREP
jgi:uroporphyrinogen-III synthase/uroporphyrinogen III methyltransferase/synthase